MQQTVSLAISGKVQGVFYRQSTRDKARELGITGTVRNNPDGTVTIVATGMPAQLEQLIAWSREGPPSAQVSRVEVKNESLQTFNGFSIVR